MKEIVVSKNEEGKRFFALLCSYMTNAPGAVLHKAIRNKNITLNGSKVKEDYRVKANDTIQVFFSDETFDKFCGDDKKNEYIERIENTSADIDVLFENDDFLAVDKKAGILSQKAADTDISINEMIISYLLKTNKINSDTLKNFRPSAVNRLDRNTSGIVLFGKTMEGLQFLSEGLRERTIHKYYKALVIGRMEKTGEFSAYLSKDAASNKVVIRNSEFKNSVLIKTKIIDCEYIKKHDLTLVSIELLTGKTHQIRALMSHLGHPILGDPKYGKRADNNKYKVKRQLLHAYKVLIPQKDIVIEASIPSDFEKVIN